MSTQFSLHTPSRALSHTDTLEDATAMCHLKAVVLQYGVLGLDRLSGTENLRDPTLRDSLNLDTERAGQMWD